MKRSNTTCFRSNKQAEAVHLMLQRQFDLFLVMPTGYGKTDLMLLTAYIEQSESRDLLSVMIVPLLSLQSDILYRCAKAGIRAATWENRSNVDSLTVLIASVEHVENPDFSRLIAEQANKERLARIEMGECHTTANWDDFRPSYASLRGNLRPSGVPVEIVLASATVSPNHTEELANKHGVMNFIEIRLPTVRRNLSYAVRHVDTPSFQNVEDRLCRESIAEIQRQTETFTPTGIDTSNGSSSGKYGNVGSKPGKEVRECVDTKALPSSQIQQPVQMILYCPTRRIRKKLSSLLSSHDFGNILVEKLGFDSSLTREEKSEVMERWNTFSSGKEKKQAGSQTLDTKSLEEGDEEEKADEGQRARSHNIHTPDFQVVVATCGFGTGIDSPYVRAVVHVGYSRSITEYVQESGRASRDGKRANCVLLFSNQLMEREKVFIAQSPSEEIETMRLDANSRPSVGLRAHSRPTKELATFNQWVVNQQSCRRQSLFGYMDQDLSGICLSSDTPHSIKSGIEQVALCDYCVRIDKDSRTTPVASGRAHQPSEHCATGQLATISEEDGFKSSRERRRRVNLTSCTNSGSAPQQQLSGSRTVERFPNVSATQTPSRTCHTRNRPFQAFQSTQNPSYTLNAASKTITPGLHPPLQLSDAKRMVDSFSLRCKELANLCKSCLVSKRVRRDTEECKDETCIEARCFRCLQTTHMSRNCELIPFRPMSALTRNFPPKPNERKNHCYACGLDRWQRVRLHTMQEFSRVDTCPYIAAFQLAAIAWRDEDCRRQLVEKFDLHKIAALKHAYDAYQDVMFFKWLRLESANTHMLHVMDVTNFILDGR